MKKFIIVFLSLLLCFSSSPSFARESLDEHTENTDELYRTGAGAKDGAYTATSTSMLAWGIALCIAIGILAATLSHKVPKTAASTTDTQ